MSAVVPDTLFIDVDNTITQPHRSRLWQTAAEVRGHRLLALMRDEAVRLHGMSREAAEELIGRVYEGKVWWDWEDYLRPLGLDPLRFWERADEVESLCLEPVDERLPQYLERLAGAGYELMITSNNPASGIRHKLRIAGMSDTWQGRYISRMLSTDLVEGIKWDVAYWTRALAIAGKRGEQVVVVGDTVLDDVRMPREAGIAYQVLLSPALPDERFEPSMIAATWEQITHWLVTLRMPKRPQRVRLTRN